MKFNSIADYESASAKIHPLSDARRGRIGNRARGRRFEPARGDDRSDARDSHQAEAGKKSSGATDASANDGTFCSVGLSGLQSRVQAATRLPLHCRCPIIGNALLRKLQASTANVSKRRLHGVGMQGVLEIC